jgi:hypothetical protein
MAEYLVLEGINVDGERKQVLVNKEAFKDNELEPKDYFVAAHSFKKDPKVVGTVYITGDESLLDSSYTAD